MAVSAKVMVKANEKLAPNSVSRKTVSMKVLGRSGKVAVKLTYNAKNRAIVLTPKRRLEAGTTYVVVVKGVRDLAGNTWDQKPGKAGAQALRFTFTTA